MERIMRILCAVVAAAVLLTSCGAKATYSYEDDAPSLAEAYKDYFRIGSAINTWNLNDPESNEYKMILKQFDTLVLENESKPDALHPTEDTYNFTNFDKFVDFCEENDIVERGHTLIWHSQCPDWFFKDGNGQASADLLVQRIKDHVTTIVSRYKGRVDTWDVVNEVIADDYGLRRSNWYNIVGDYDGDGDSYDFIETAFIAAHEADPDARLIINDYSLESSSNKVITMYNAVKKMLEDGVPIDGVGFQMHIGLGMDLERMEDNFRIIAKLREINPDLIIEVTEMDMNCYNEDQNGNSIPLSKEQEQQFNETYVGVFNLLLDLAEEGVLDSAIFWGLHDGTSWLNGQHQTYPMLFDREMKMKDTFWDIIELPEKR